MLSTLLSGDLLLFVDGHWTDNYPVRRVMQELVLTFGKQKYILEDVPLKNTLWQSQTGLAQRSRVGQTGQLLQNQ
jgi:hypothetical protein